MEGVVRHNASDLTLKVRSSYDIKKLNLDVWEDYQIFFAVIETIKRKQ